MITKEYVLEKFEEDPDIRFYDIMYPNKKDTVESLDNDKLSHDEAKARLIKIMNVLDGTYIIRLRAKTKVETSKGGSNKPVGEYTVRFGNGSGSSDAGIGMIPQGGSNLYERLMQTQNEATKKDLQHQMEVFMLKHQMQELKRKKGDDGIGGLETILMQAIAKQYNLPGMGATQSAPVITAAPGINGIDSEQEAETRATNAIARIAKANPQGVIIVLEGLADLFEKYPEKVNALNQAFTNISNGQELLVSFMPLING